MALIWHTDPGHGWLAVPVVDLLPLGLTLDMFSRYSYIAKHGGTVYLEEDCDAPKFLARYEAVHGEEPAIMNDIHLNDSHWIRSLPSIVEDR